jgi:hypothetical protein
MMGSNKDGRGSCEDEPYILTEYEKDVTEVYHQLQQSPYLSPNSKRRG